jgi:hypothetical protein
MLPQSKVHLRYAIQSDTLPQGSNDSGSGNRLFTYWTPSLVGRLTDGFEHRIYQAPYVDLRYCRNARRFEQGEETQRTFRTFHL